MKYKLIWTFDDNDLINVSTYDNVESAVESLSNSIKEDICNKVIESLKKELREKIIPWFDGGVL